MTDATTDQQPAKRNPAAHLKKHRWKAGQSGNMKGRPKGSRNKLGEDFLRDLYKHWKEHGPSILIGAMAESPMQFARMVSSLLPKEMLAVVLTGDKDDLKTVAVELLGRTKAGELIEQQGIGLNGSTIDVTPESVPAQPETEKSPPAATERATGYGKRT